MDRIIETKRLRLHTMNAEFLRLSLDRDHRGAEDALGLTLPESWPTERDVLEYRLGQLEIDPDCEPWLTRVIELRGEGRVIGVIGFHGPPGSEHLREMAPGGVEFGYTVYAPWQRRGFAFEASIALMAWATRVHGVSAFALSMSPSNHASVGVARKLGFERAGSWHHDARGEEDVYRLITGGNAEPRSDA